MILAYDAAIKGLVLGDDRFRGEFIAGDGLCGASHGDPPGWILDQELDFACKGAGVAGRNQESCGPVLDDLGDSADAGGDAGAGEAHRLKDAQAKAFHIGREEREIGGLEVLFDVADFFAHNDLIFEIETADIRNKRIECFAGEDDELERIAGE